MGARSRMTMRCSTERDVAGAQVDPFNQPITTATAVLSDHPCYWQSKAERFVNDGDKLAAIASHLLLVPLETDLDEQDRVTAVKTRRGKSLKSTKLRVIALVQREDHIEAMCEEYT